MMNRFASLLMPRFLRFRKEVVLLWKAFWAPATPFHLKAATVLAAAYLLWPLDILPDFIPIAGWIDDILIVPFIISWIVSRLPTDPVPATRQGPIIDGTVRRATPQSAQR